MLSGIWSKAINDKRMIGEKTIISNTLEEAATIALASTDIKFAFRRNRELVDIFGKFRCFSYCGKEYIIKRVDTPGIPREYVNAVKASKLLDSIKEKYDVPIPLLIHADGVAGLVYPDFGFSLYEHVSETKKIPISEITSGFKTLISHGIEWAGWLPRNIFKLGDKLILIDWEDAIFHDENNTSVSNLTLLKLTLGWSQIYGSIKEVQDAFNAELNDIDKYIAPNDEFETIFGKLAAVDDRVSKHNICAVLTLISEGPMAENMYDNLSLMDVGHLIDELFGDYVSVLYTVCSSLIRRELGDSYCGAFAQAFETLLCVSLKELGAKTINIPLNNVRPLIMLLILYYFQKPAIENFQQLKRIGTLDGFWEILKRTNNISHYMINYLSCEKTGETNLFIRGAYIQQFLEALFEILKECFGNLSSLDFLLRGSCAHGLMTVNSDVDFEISGIMYPNGNLDAEHLISDVLDIFEISNEGSQGRPNEKDFESSEGYTREYHEWMELTKPNTVVVDKGWLDTKIVPDDKFWLNCSEYEIHGSHITPKILFFKIRTLIMRMAARCDIHYASGWNQLKALRVHLGNNAVEQVTSVMIEILELYENNDLSTKKLLCALEKIEQLSFKYLETDK